MTKSEISVVVPCTNSFSDFRSCAQALERQTGPCPAIVAVERHGADFVAQIEAEFPDVHIISVPHDMSIPSMRAVGMREAKADVIGVLEDHVIVPPDWTLKMLDEIDKGADVVAGPLDNLATETLVDWAAFLCEYSAILPPLNDGPSDWLPGNNTVYRHDTLRRHDAILDEGRWENRLHDRIREDGGTLTLRNDILSGHKMHYSFWLYLSQRFLYSRAFAGMRVEDAAYSKRLLMGLLALSLPVVMYYRIVRNVVRKGRHIGKLAASLPLLVPFTLSWGLGEVAGYWFGAGRALSSIR